MKAALLIPVRFVLVCLSAVVVTSTIYVLVNLGIAYSPGDTTRAPLLAVTLFNSFHHVFVFSVLSTVVIVLFHILRLDRLRGFSLLLVYLVALAALLGGIRGINALSAGSERLPSAQLVQPGVIYRVGDDLFYAGKRTGLSLGPVVQFDRSADPPRFSLHSEAIEDPYDGTLRIVDNGAEYSLNESETSVGKMFAPQPALANVFSDIESLNDSVFSQSLSEGIRSSAFILPFATLISFLLCVTGMWFLARLTRWPLFNFVLVVAMVRLLLFLFSFLQSKGFVDIATIVLKEQYVRYVPPAAFLFIGIIFLVITALLPPFGQWRREVAS